MFFILKQSENSGQKSTELEGFFIFPLISGPREKMDAPAATPTSSAPLPNTLLPSQQQSAAVWTEHEGHVYDQAFFPVSFQ